MSIVAINSEGNGLAATMIPYALTIAWLLPLGGFAILVFFGRKLPDLGEGLGKGIRNFRKSIKEPDEIDVTPKEGEEKEKNKKGPS